LKFNDGGKKESKVHKHVAEAKKKEKHING
jgi:hypothetical protein